MQIRLLSELNHCQSRLNSRRSSRGATLVSCLSVGLLSYEMGKSGLIDASKIRLETVAGNQSKQLDAYTLRVEQSISELSQNAAIAQALETMTNVVPTEKDAIIQAFRREGVSEEERASFNGEGLRLLYAIRHATINATIASVLAQHPGQRYL